MSKKGMLMRGILIASSAFIIIGIALMGWIMTTEEERNNIEVVLSDGKTQAIEFNDLALIPGSECEYKIKLKNTNAKEYELKLDFVEIEEKVLKNFACVKILSNGAVICDELLATAFENDSIVLPVNFNTGTNTELTIVYYLPLDVGNEAKNAEAVFELRLTASNE